MNRKPNRGGAVRLSESKLRAIIAESLTNILNEDLYDDIESQKEGVIEDLQHKVWGIYILLGEIEKYKKEPDKSHRLYQALIDNMEFVKENLPYLKISLDRNRYI